ncbi:MAG: metallophosphoesterase [Flammeovirgaceae bacterium]
MYRSLLRYFVNKKMWVRIGYLSTVAVGVGAIVVANFAFKGGYMQPSTFTNIMLGLLVTLFFTKLFFLPFPLFEDLFRLLKFGYDASTKALDKNRKPAKFWSRRRFIGKLGLAVAALPFSAFLYGVFKGRYDFTVHHVSVPSPDLPAAFDGFKIAQISDVHAGSFDRIEAVKKGIDLIQAQGADVIVFTGDLVNNRALEVEPYIEHFGKLSAPYGKYAVLGNHDYGNYVKWPSPEAKNENLATLAQHHKDMGFRLMNNESVLIEKEGASIRLAGVENWGKKPFPQYGDLSKTFQQAAADDFSILLSHDPSHWDEQVIDFSQKIHLTLSGHTHGMQMGVEIPGFRWSPVKYRYPRWAGLYEAKNQFLYVNRGFGFIGFPGRVGIWPEITVLELKRTA